MASFVRPNRRMDPPFSFLGALHERYVAEEVSQNGTAAQNTYFNGKLAEEVGFDKIKQQLSALKQLKIVVLDFMRIEGQMSSLSRDYGNGREISKIAEEIRATCPSVTQLSLGQNLIESLSDVALICSALYNLTNLELSRNRFKTLAQSPGIDSILSSGPFNSITNLKLDRTLILWDDVVKLVHHMPKLQNLSCAGSEYDSLSGQLPHKVEELNLSFNDFTSLEELSSLASLPNLKKLILHKCPLKALANQTTKFQAVSDLDLTESDLSPTELQNLGTNFPSIGSLKCSGLDQPKALVLMARLGSVEELNSNQITKEMRANAEIYYLNSIAKEMTSSSGAESHILSRHPRWDELCKIYGAPTFDKRPLNVEPKSNYLGTTFIEILLQDTRKEQAKRGIYSLRVSRSLSTQRLYMFAAKMLNDLPRHLRLVWEDARDPTLSSEIRNKVNMDGPKPKQTRLDAYDGELVTTDQLNTQMMTDKDTSETLPQDKELMEEAYDARRVELPLSRFDIGRWISSSSVLLKVEDAVLP